MAKNSEVYANKITAYHYPEGVAPFGELMLLNILHNVKTDGDTSSQKHSRLNLANAAPAIIYDTWATSEWLPQEVGEKAAADFRMYGSAAHPLHEMIDSSVARAARNPSKHSAWFAIRPITSQAGERTAYFSSKGYICTYQVVGFGLAQHEAAGRGIHCLKDRLLSSKHADVAIPYLGVRAEEQSKYIGAALLGTILNSYETDMRLTLSVAAANKNLIAKLEELTCEVIGSELRRDILNGSSIEEVKLQGSSVYEASNALLKKYPWQLQAVPQV